MMMQTRVCRKDMEVENGHSSSMLMPSSRDARDRSGKVLDAYFGSRPECVTTLFGNEKGHPGEGAKISARSGPSLPLSYDVLSPDVSPRDSSFESESSIQAVDSRLRKFAIIDVRTPTIVGKNVLGQFRARARAVVQ